MNQTEGDVVGGEWLDGGGTNEGNNYADGGGAQQEMNNEQEGNTMGNGGNDSSTSAPGKQNNQNGPRQNNFKRMNRNNQRYNDAYGDYTGGYGPPGPYRGPPNFGPWGGPPPPQLGMGYGHRGPPQRHANQAMQYLLRCGVPRDTIKTLPREIFQLIEPEFCGVCSVDLESYQYSRMHYSSKVHLKNQRKWVLLFNSSGVGPFNNREVPLKSRDLYCELCDVHITSKQHADSHYSGKQHRAVVIGRKQPKNTLLLQRGNEGRLEQLIRREKKHMKPEEQSEGDAKEGKPLQPDLYCEICQTTMTNSEQMTMHLNGKKHLSKEKQHILKMMKGPATDKLATESTNPTASDTQDGQDNGNEDNGTEQPTEDWVNGSGDDW